MIAGRLDRFLIKDDLMNIFVEIRWWVAFGGILDHSPIYLKLDGASPKPKSPFKFYSTCLRDEVYQLMVKHTWQETNLFDDQSMATYFAEKLNLLKKKTIIWTREKKKKDDDSKC